MLDIKWIRENQDSFVKGLTNRGFDEPRATLARLLSLDEERRETIQKLQEKQASANLASKAIGLAIQAKDQVAAEAQKKKVLGLKDKVREDEAKEKQLDSELRALLAAIPNTPAPDVPVGPDDRANKVLREVGKPKEFSFTPKQHFELGEALGLMDFKTAAKLSGARFVVLKGALARLERALAQFMLDLHTNEHGYTEINPPLLVRDDAMFGTAQLPKFRDDQFQSRLNRFRTEQFTLASGATAVLSGERNIEFGTTEIASEYERILQNYPEALRSINFVKGERPELTVDQRIWLIPTAEVPLTNLVRDDIVGEADLPMRVTAWTPCFRAEAGAAGKDTRGMIRQHQFSKVELVSVTTPEQSAEEHERMTECAEKVLKQLEIPYRVVVLSTGDMGFAAEKTYDIEVWLPGQGTYREISSCSNCGDFQARRMNARYRPDGQKHPRLVHTLNGSGVAVGRALIAVLENYQEQDGSIRVPDALLPYMGGVTKIAPPE